MFRLPVIGPSFRVYWKRVSLNVRGVPDWALFGASKLKEMNNNKNKTLQIRLQY